MFFKKKRNRDLSKLYNRIVEIEKEEGVIDNLLSKLDTIINIEIDLQPKVSKALDEKKPDNHIKAKKKIRKKQSKKKITKK